MQSKERLAIIGTGHIRIYNAAINELLYEQHNDIQEFAKEAMTKLLYGELEYAPSHIEALYMGVGLKKKAIFRRELTGVNEVEFAVLFEPVDFDSSFDELNLHCENHGIFSIATGVAASKSSSESLLVTWTITIA